MIDHELMQMKQSILNRLNRKMRSQRGSQETIATQSFPDLEESRNKYINKLNHRIQSLEQEADLPPVAPKPKWKSQPIPMDYSEPRPLKKSTPLKPISRKSISDSQDTLQSNGQLIPEYKAIQTVSCPNCERSFTVDRIAKHKTICKGLKKRPKFDPQKMRVKGTELENFKPKPDKKKKPSGEKKDWRNTHSRPN